jgi:hypothetical protein
MREDTAQLPVDFLVGFTIFILCLIAVANFVPSLLVGLQRTSGIDYNAVAYRTGVVLVEDPGEPKGNRILGTIYGTDFQPWELQTGDYIIRLGLALTADTPNILSLNKINKFFDTGVFNDDPTSPLNDYRQKLLFSTYMYGYNVTLQNISPMKPGEPASLKKMIGQPYPAGGYGYIRRYVLIKQNSDAVINVNSSKYPDPITNPWNNLSFDAYIPGEVKQGCPADVPVVLPCLRVRLPGEILYNKTIAPQYQIDLQRESFTINVTNLTNVLNNSVKNPSPLALDMVDNATLEYIRFFDEMGAERTAYSRLELRIDNELGTMILNPQGEVKRKVNDTLQLFVSPLWPTTGDPSCPSCGIIGFDEYQDMDIVFSFANDNRTLVKGTFLYDYRNVTEPPLATGMLEVGIW